MPIANSMNLAPHLLQFLGSLVAICALAGLAWWLKLGGTPVLASEAEARIAANEAVDGFEPVSVAIDADGRGAIMRDQTGRVLVLKPHGNKFAGRILRNEANALVANGSLQIDSGEKRYGLVSLAIDDPEAWAGAINLLSSSSDA